MKKYVTGCDTCQQMKNCLQQSYGPLQLNAVLEVWDIITTDLITLLLELNEYDAICIVMNRLTK